MGAALHSRSIRDP